MSLGDKGTPLISINYEGFWMDDNHNDKTASFTMSLPSFNLLTFDKSVFLRYWWAFWKIYSPKHK